MKNRFIERLVDLVAWMWAACDVARNYASAGASETKTKSSGTTKVSATVDRQQATTEAIEKPTSRTSAILNSKNQTKRKLPEDNLRNLYK